MISLAEIIFSENKFIMIQKFDYISVVVYLKINRLFWTHTYVCVWVCVHVNLFIYICMHVVVSMGAFMRGYIYIYNACTDDNETM